MLGIPKLMKRDEVEATIGVSRRTLQRMVAKGAFPAPIKLGPQLNRWRSDEVAAWLDDFKRTAA